MRDYVYEFDLLYARLNFVKYLKLMKGVTWRMKFLVRLIIIFRYFDMIRKI